MRIFACVLYNYSNVVVLTANAVSNLSLATGGYSQTTYYNKKNLSHLVDLLVKTLGVFWTAVKKEKPVLGGEAVKMLLPLATTYLCESGFAALTDIKTRYRNRL